MTIFWAIIGLMLGLILGILIAPTPEVNIGEDSYPIEVAEKTIVACEGVVESTIIILDKFTSQEACISSFDSLDLLNDREFQEAFLKFEEFIYYFGEVE